MEKGLGTKIERVDGETAALKSEMKESSQRIDKAAKVIAGFNEKINGEVKALHAKMDGIKETFDSKISTTNKIAGAILAAIVIGLISMWIKF